MGRGSSPSINLQAGAGAAHARERSKACALLAARGGAGCQEPRVSVCLAPGALLFGLQPGMGLWVGTRGQLGQLAREGGRRWLPGGYRGKLEKPARCAHPLGLWPARSILPPSPPRPAEMPTGTQGQQVQQPGLLAFLGRDRRCRSTPVLRAELDGRAGASHRGAEGVGREDRAVRGGRRMRTCTHAETRRGAVTGSGSTAACWVSVRRWWVAR